LLEYSNFDSIYIPQASSKGASPKVTKNSFEPNKKDLLSPVLSWKGKSSFNQRQQPNNPRNDIELED
jgi:hypothetical protein